jgi:hypothetical protein
MFPCLQDKRLELISVIEPEWFLKPCPALQARQLHWRIHFVEPFPCAGRALDVTIACHDPILLLKSGSVVIRKSVSSTAIVEPFLLTGISSDAIAGSETFPSTTNL